MALATALAIGGMALGAAGAYSSSKAGKDAAQGQEKLAEYNALVAEQDARATELQTKFEQVRQAQRGEQIRGDLKARLGASGAVVSEGAPLAAMARQAFELELENALIGYQGQTQAARFRSEAQAYRLGAQAARKQASNAMKAGWLNIGSTILGGLGSLASQGMFSPSTPATGYVQSGGFNVYPAH